MSFACVCIFVNPSCKYTTKIQTHRRVIACVCIFVTPSCKYFTNASIRKQSNASSCHGVRLYFCKPILQIYYKDANAPFRQQAAHRHFIACVCIGVNPSCKYFTPIQTHQSENKATHRHVMACVCIFINPSCKYFTPIQARRAYNKQRIVGSSCHCVRLYFCKPILQIYY